MPGLGFSTLPLQATTVAIDALALPNLMQMKQKPGKNVYERGAGQAIDEIVLHGTESLGTAEQSATYLASANDKHTSIHYFIGRDFGVLYAIVPEEKAAGHAGGNAKLKNPDEHNYRSIGIELYQQDISLFKGDASKLDFTEWQYDTVAMLVYDIRRRRGIGRDMVVSHASLDAQRGDPRNFDWDRFNRQVDRLSITLGARFGAAFTLP